MLRISWFHLVSCNFNLGGVKRYLFDYGQICCSFIANSRCSIPPKKIGKMIPNCSKRTLGVGIGAFKKFHFFFGICKLSFLKVPNSSCTGLSTFW